MANEITITAYYTACATGVVDLSPKAWSDVKKWYIKWDILHVLFDGQDTWTTFEIDSDSSDGVDWKRPESVDIHEGNLEFEETLASA